MTKSHQKLYAEKDSAKQFLFSKTDSKIQDIKHVNKLQSVDLSDKFSNLLSANEFIDSAMSKINSSKRFCAIIVRLDNLLPSKDKSSTNDNPELVVKIANIINSVSKHENAPWSQLEYDIFGLFCFEKDNNYCMELARKVQKDVNRLCNKTISIGIASYPTINYNKYEILDNARKVLDHAAFFGDGSAVCFDAVSLNISADNLYQKGDICGAIEEFKKGLMLDPLNINIHNSLGVCYGVLGSFKNAKEEFETVLWLDQNEVMAMYNLGLINLLMDNKEKALNLFLEAENIEENLFEVKFQIGKLYFELGDLEKGKKYLEKAVDIRPEASAAFRYLGDCNSAINNIDEAILSYKKAIKLNPNDADSLSALGYLFEIKNENPEIAIIFCQQGVEISPENGLFRHRLGRLYFKQNKNEDAMKEFKKANNLGYDSMEFIDKLNNLLGKSS